MLLYSLRIVDLLDVVITALYWRDRNDRLFDQKAHIPAEPTYVDCVPYDRFGHQCGSGWHYCHFPLLPPIQSLPQFNTEKVSGLHK
jgi:hypothetical protein